jgi:tRNA pseudouridine38-40 synthase
MLLRMLARAFALRLAYDGTEFAGWWRQRGARTVGSELDAACARIGEPRASPVAASRTDAGVHARGQVAHVHLARAWEPSQLALALAPQLPADLRVRAVAAVDADWHAVHLARAKTYSYAIDNSLLGDPFLRLTHWRPPFRIALEAVQEAAAPLCGRRDWRGFARRGDAREDLVCAVEAIRWSAAGDTLLCRIRADRFIYRLARSLIGAMVAQAHGSLDARAIARAIAGERSGAGAQQAPAHGLCLEEVHYEPAPRWRTPGADRA